MPDPIQINGDKRLVEAFKKFPKQVARNVRGAANQSYEDVILPTKGLKNYPPMTGANQPPTPYYIRGRGTQTSAKHNLMNSERLGTQWYLKTESWTARIGNRASYAQWVHGENQAKAMGKIGWRKLVEVAHEKIGEIQNVYSRWISKTLKDLGL